MNNKTKNIPALICGVLGCLCYGGGDWLMMYGDPAHTGKLAWLNSNGFSQDSITICESLFANFSWLVPVSEIVMLSVFLYWFYLQITSKTVFKKGMAFTNVLVIFAALKTIASFMPVSAFRLGFTNGLMRESMIIWFVLILMGVGIEKRYGESH